MKFEDKIPWLVEDAYGYWAVDKEEAVHGWVHCNPILVSHYGGRWYQNGSEINLDPEDFLFSLEGIPSPTLFEIDPEWQKTAKEAYDAEELRLTQEAEEQRRRSPPVQTIIDCGCCDENGNIVDP